MKNPGKQPTDQVYKNPTRIERCHSDITANTFWSYSPRSPFTKACPSRLWKVTMATSLTSKICDIANRPPTNSAFTGNITVMIHLPKVSL